MIAFRTLAPMLIVGGAFLDGCAAQPAPAPVAIADGSQSILAASVPGAGTTVREPVDDLRLTFAPPARLDELLVHGPSGDMPTMIHSLGEQANYIIPLSGIGPGTYRVDWRATAQGRESRGSFSFSVE